MVYGLPCKDGIGDGGCMDDKQCDGLDARLVLVEERTERNDQRITAHGRQIDSLRSDMDRIKAMFDRYQVTLDRLEMKVDKILEVPGSRWNESVMVVVSVAITAAVTFAVTHGGFPS